MQRRSSIYTHIGTNDKNGFDDVISLNKTVISKRNVFCIGGLYYKL